VRTEHQHNGDIPSHVALACDAVVTCTGDSILNDLTQARVTELIRDPREESGQLPDHLIFETLRRRFLEDLHLLGTYDHVSTSPANAHDKNAFDWRPILYKDEELRLVIAFQHITADRPKKGFHLFGVARRQIHP